MLGPTQLVDVAGEFRGSLYQVGEVGIREVDPPLLGKPLRHLDVMRCAVGAHESKAIARRCNSSSSKMKRAWETFLKISPTPAISYQSASGRNDAG